MSKKDSDDYAVLFQGAKLSTVEANRVGLGLVFGILGSLIAIFTPIAQAKFLAYGFIALFSILGYCLGIKFFKKK